MLLLCVQYINARVSGTVYVCRVVLLIIRMSIWYYGVVLVCTREREREREIVCVYMCVCMCLCVYNSVSCVLCIEKWM